MKFYTSAALALTLGSAAGFRTQETKKVPKEERQLEETCDYGVDHDAVQSLKEIQVNVYPFPGYYSGKGVKGDRAKDEGIDNSCIFDHGPWMDCRPGLSALVGWRSWFPAY